MTNYVGVAPLTTVIRTNGQAESVYSGGPVPGDAKPEEIDRLVDEGFIIADPDGISGGMPNDDPSMTVHDAVALAKEARTTKAKSEA